MWNYSWTAGSDFAASDSRKSTNSSENGLSGSIEFEPLDGFTVNHPRHPIEFVSASCASSLVKPNTARRICTPSDFLFAEEIIT